MRININKLRRDLEDYYGTAMFTISPVAMMDLEKVQKASEDELIEIAKECGFNINKYIVS